MPGFYGSQMYYGDSSPGEDWRARAGSEGSVWYNPNYDTNSVTAMTPTPQIGTGDLMYSSGMGPAGGMYSADAGVSPSGGQSIFDTAGAGYAGGMGTLGAVANPFAVNMTMNQFVNPYRESVIQNALGRSRDARNEDLNQVRGQAAQASAYGGARHGLVEAELMDRYSRNENEMLANMYQQGFDTRANLALQTLGQRAQAGQAMVGGAATGAGIGADALSRQQQSGLMQQQLMQRILSQGAGQTGTMLNYPSQALAQAMAGIQGNPLAGNVTRQESYTPGLFDYASFGAGLAGGGK